MDRRSRIATEVRERVVKVRSLVRELAVLNDDYAYAVVNESDPWLAKSLRKSIRELSSHIKHEHSLIGFLVVEAAVLEESEELFSKGVSF